MSTEIATFGTLFRTAWDQYKNRAMPLLAVMLISAVVIGGLVLSLMLCVTLGGAILAHFTNERTVAYLVVALICVLLLAATLLVFWSQTAMLALVVHEELGIIEAFRTGWTYLWPMAWVMTLLTAILLTGFLLGILPGLLFLVWFTFCMYVLLEEDRRGMDALLASKEYVRGHWWNTFGKIIVLWLISAVAGFIPFIGQVFSFLFAPFFMLFLLAMYRDLKEVKGVAVTAAGSGRLAFWWTLAVLGMVLPLVALIAVLFTLLSGEQEWMHVPRSMHGKWL
jgi:MFS family permease